MTKLMVDGDPGPAGLAAPSLVAQDLELDQEGVILLPMVDNIVQGYALPLKIVTQDVVQLMVIGDLGLPGLPVASHVEQEQDLGQEAAAVLDLHVAEEAAQDQAP